MSDTRPIDSIIVGERHRRDMGDIDGLAASIAEVGLLHPVVVRPAGLAHRRRAPASAPCSNSAGRTFR